jgi:hypothetical protein
VWAVAGGDASYGGEPTNPSNTAFAAVSNAEQWNHALVAMDDALVRDGSGNASAIVLAQRHRIEWYAPGNEFAAYINSIVTDGDKVSGLQFVDDGQWFMTRGQRAFAVYNQAGSAPANFLQVNSSASGSQPSLIAFGTDTNVDLKLVPQGAGLIRFGTHQGEINQAVCGSIAIKDAGGTTRKLAVLC